MPRRLAVVLAIVALLVSFGPATAFALAAGPGAKPDKCAQGNNNTPEKLLPCIRTDDLWHHMQALQAIADANPGPGRPPVAQLRRAGLQGLGGLCREPDAQRGYNVTIQTYKFYYFAYQGVADASARTRRPRTTTRSSPTGIPGRAPGSDDRGSAAGRRHRHPADATPSPRAAAPGRLHRLRRGRIALIQRGTCNFGEKVAQRAGRRRLRRDHLQRGQPGRSGVFGGSLAERTATGSSRPSRSRSRRSPRQRPVQPVQPAVRTRRALPNMNLTSRPSATRTATTTTSSPSRRAATRTTWWSSTRTSTQSTAPACSTTRPVR